MPDLQAAEGSMKLFGAGPLEQWQHELRKVSRSGLVELVEDLIFLVQGLGAHSSNGALVKTMQRAKTSGRAIDAHSGYMRLVNDPKEIDRVIRKSNAAKKAARRRKRERRAA
jgi:hypothetical protein